MVAEELVVVTEELDLKPVVAEELVVVAGELDLQPVVVTHPLLKEVRFNFPTCDLD